MKTPKEVFTCESTDSAQARALKIIHEFVIANGNKKTQHIKCLSGKEIGVDTSTANGDYTQGFFAFLYFADKMKSCFTHFFQIRESVLAVRIKHGSSWNDFIEEFKEID